MFRHCYFVTHQTVGRTSGRLVSALNNYLEPLPNQLEATRKWKANLNALTKEEYENYRQHKIPNYRSRMAASRGYYKMDELLKYHVAIQGKVVDLGAGSGGWSQRVAMEEDVESVHGITLGWSIGRQHNEFIADQLLTKGHYKITHEKGDVFKMTLPKADWYLMDIAESHTNQEVEAQADIKRLRWMKQHGGKWIMKVLVSCDPRVQDEIPKGYKLVRLFNSRNSNMEAYVIPGTIDLPKWTANLLSELDERMRDAKMGKCQKVAPSARAPAVMYTQPPAKKVVKHSDIECEDRINHTQQRWNRTCEDEFAHWKPKAWRPVNKDTKRGDKGNPILQFMWGTMRHMVPGVEYWHLTDVTATETFKMFKNKVDTTPASTPEALKRMKVAFNIILEHYRTKGFRMRILSNEEIKAMVRNDAALGLRGDDAKWHNAEEALDDPEFWRLVDEEDAAHDKGKCYRCMFNTAGKREKKWQRVKGKGSRLICFLPLISRVLEMRYLGCVNSDHMCSPEYLPSGVSGVSPYEYGAIFARKSQFDSYTEKMGRTVFSDDTAAWDTKVNRDVLCLEEGLFKDLASEEQARKIAQIYSIYKDPLIELKMPYTDDKDKSVILQGYGQRCSGTVIL
nr:polyprotein [Western carp gudgeon flavivirus]